MEILRAIAGVSGILFCSISSAIPVKGHFTGVVDYSTSQLVNESGTWGPTTYSSMVGQSVNGFFTFDTDNVPNDYYSSDPTIGLHYESNNYHWLDLTFVVNGNSYSVEDPSATNPDDIYTSQDLISISDDHMPYAASERDKISLMEKVHEHYYDEVNNTQIYNRQSAQLNIFSWNDFEFVNGLALDQTITLTDLLNFDTKLGSFSDFSHIYDYDSDSLSSGKNLRFDFELTDFSMSAVKDDPTSVPEPSVITLLTASLISVGLIRRKKSLEYSKN